MLKKLFVLGALALAFMHSQALAAYGNVTAVTDAVDGVVDTATTTFLSAATIGVAVITVSVVAYVLRKGVKLR